MYFLPFLRDQSTRMYFSPHFFSCPVENRFLSGPTNHGVFPSNEKKEKKRRKCVYLISPCDTRPPCDVDRQPFEKTICAADIYHIRRKRASERERERERERMRVRETFSDMY